MKQIVERKVDRLLPREPINYDEIPVITSDEYKARVNSLLELSGERGYTHILVYADREHFSNMEYLTKFDPRFEEAILILSKDEIPTIVLGKEGMDYAGIIPYEVKTELFESFSLMGQSRGNSKSLRNIMESTGISKNSKVGVIGWKYFGPIEFENYKHCMEIPHYMAELLIELAGRENVINANELMVSNDYGLRHNLDAKELIYHEVAGTKASRRVYDVIKNLREGISEIEASEYLCIDGDPIATHPNINFGAKNTLYGLASPTYHKKLSYGELISVGMGYRRAQVHRIGIYARNNQDIPLGLSNIVEDLYKPYFNAIAKWYETIGIGVTGGEIYSVMKETLGSFEKFGVSLNPGHLIHTDEWTNTIFQEGSKIKVRSGMAIQCDMISAIQANQTGAHIEDGIVVADRSLREEIKRLAPGSWNRIVARRKFMKEVLGIHLAEEILPTSDLPGVHFPYMADTSIILAKKE